MKILMSVLATAAFSSTAFATSNNVTCSDSFGSVSVVDGNVTIVDGIGDVGAATKMKVIKEISENTEQCVEGPNYVFTKVTVQEVTYDLEEGVSASTIVLCTQVQTGISSQTCN